MNRRAFARRSDFVSAASSHALLHPSSFSSFIPAFQVSLAQNFDVVRLVAGDDVGEGAHADLVVAGGAAPRHASGERWRSRWRVAARTASNSSARSASVRASKSAPAIYSSCSMPGSAGRVAARDAERAVGEDALAVADVADELLDAPLAGLVDRCAPCSSGSRAQQRQRLCALPLQRLDHVAVGHERDVLLVVRRVLVRSGRRGLLLTCVRSFQWSGSGQSSSVLNSSRCHVPLAPRAVRALPEIQNRSGSTGS